MVAGTEFDDVLTGGAGDDVLEGRGGNDRLSGLSGNDALLGGAGADILDGGAGIDLASYYDSTAAVAVSLATQSGQGGDAEGDTLTGIEDLEGSAWNDTLTGDDGNNWLYGLAGNDRLFGGGGDDVLVGGAGADTLDGGVGVNAVSYAGSVVGVYVNLSSGNGAYGDAAGDRLLNISDLIGSAFADNIRGNAADNWLGGGAGNDSLMGEGGNDVLVGGAGADLLYGGAGFNMASYTGSAAGVVADLDTGEGSLGDAEGDHLYQIGALYGSSFADTLRGSGRAEWLNGAAGSDSLSGHGGADTLIGGDGADTLDGGDGDDWLVGGAGADVLGGSLGSDTVSYEGTAAGVYVNLSSGNGAYGDAAGDRLSDVENVVGTDFADSIRGNADDNWLAGGAGADTLKGEGGHDLLEGGAGADALYGADGYDAATYVGSAAGVSIGLAAGTAAGGDADGDTLYQIEDLIGSGFNDRLTGDANGNWLEGGVGGDVLDGGAGNDTLKGGAWGDMLTGGTGADRFLYTDVTDSGPAFTTSDWIWDFSRGTDRIDLSAIDANTTVAGNQAFAFIGTAAFTAAGQLRLTTANGELSVAGDINGDKIADFAITIAGGVVHLAASDFAL